VKAANLNLAAVKSRIRLRCGQPYQARSLFHPAHGQNRRQIIIDGNSAAALGCMFAGATMVAWYPITPSSSLPESMIEYMKALPHRCRRQSHICDRTGGRRTGGHRNGVGRRLGRSACHDSDRRPRHFAHGRICRPCLLRRSPGVIWDIQRVGPSTGLAHANVARRHSLHRVSLSWRHQAHPPAPMFRGGVFHHGRRRF